MADNRIYGAEDCIERGHNVAFVGKVIVISAGVLPPDAPEQLMYCTGGFGSRPNAIGRTVSGWSLHTGEFISWWRQDVVGVLNPELLPDEARLQLSRIRPAGFHAREDGNPVFYGHCILPDGRSVGRMPLYSEEEVKAYARMQAPWQHRVVVCDRDDHRVLEMEGISVICPHGMRLDDWTCEPERPEPGIGMRGYE